MSILIVLPAHNEAAALPWILRSLGKLREDGLDVKVVVVDDGSTDETADLVRCHQPPPEVKVIRHPQNLGLATALRSGITAAVSEARDDSVIVTMDADGTHDPFDIRRLAGPILVGESDVVIGSRFATGGDEVGIPVHRRILSRGAGLLLKAAAPIRGVRDYTSGFRAYRTSILKRILSEAPGVFEARGFSITAALLLAAARLGARITEVPVTVRYDRKVGPSKMPVAATIRGTMAVAAAFRRKEL